MKLTLLDDEGNPLVSSSFTEKLLSDMKQFHKVDFIQEMVNAMKMEIGDTEGGSPMTLPHVEGRNWFSERMTKTLIERRTSPLDGLIERPIEDGIMVTREDVQDYIAFNGGEPEAA